MPICKTSVFWRRIVEGPFKKMERRALFEKREGNYNDHCTVVVVIGLPFFYTGPG